MLKWLVLVLVLLPAAGCSVGKETPSLVVHEKSVPDASELGDYGEVPDFKLTSHLGRPITTQDLKGQVWVACFFFTDCKNICPMMTAQLSKLQEDYGKLGLKIVSISVNPEVDSPEKMAEHAERIGADPKTWLFLTGDKQKIIELSVSGFRLPADQDPNSHSNRFVLIDRQGKIRGYYRSDEEEQIRVLHKTVEKLLSS
ncbi:MAG: SCO family protein [Acidobacteriota bacterium]|nr:SCO family protein [Blastocatellia bacterium]MDW8411788.1 SCO family protein [Acidobacteriota bacterium]